MLVVVLVVVLVVMGREQRCRSRAEARRPRSAVAQRSESCAKAQWHRVIIFFARPRWRKSTKAHNASTYFA